MAPLLFLLVSLIAAARLALGDRPVEVELITAQDVPLLGGWFQRSAESEEVQAAVRSAVDDFNRKSKARKYFRLISITSAKTQVTNQINYRIEVVLGKTKCLKTETPVAEVDLDNCALGKKRLTCRFELHFDPRTNTHKDHYSSCHKQAAV